MNPGLSSYVSLEFRQDPNSHFPLTEIFTVVKKARERSVYSFGKGPHLDI